MPKTDGASKETAVVYVPANRLAKVDAIHINTPLANRVLTQDKALAPTAVHFKDAKDATITMPGFPGKKKLDVLEFSL